MRGTVSAGLVATAAVSPPAVSSGKPAQPAAEDGLSAVVHLRSLRRT
jgi:hypothetical protein